VRTAALVAACCLLASCGSGGSAHKALRHHQQPKLAQHLTGAAAERIGAEACKRLPTGQPRTAASLRAYLQQAHPTDDVAAMLRGCRRELHG
jgi:hypothetical protein